MQMIAVCLPRITDHWTARVARSIVPGAIRSLPVRRVPQRCRGNGTHGVVVRIVRGGALWYASGPGSESCIAPSDDAVVKPCQFGRIFRRNTTDAARVAEGGGRQTPRYVTRLWMTPDAASGGSRGTVRLRWYLEFVDPAMLRAVASCAAWCALGGKAVPFADVYPDVFAVFRDGTSRPDTTTPADLLACIARVAGNDGVDYCIREALGVLCPNLFLPLVTDREDPWFLGLTFPESGDLLWLGGHPRGSRGDDDDDDDCEDGVTVDRVLAGDAPLAL